MVSANALGGEFALTDMKKSWFLINSNNLEQKPKLAYKRRIKYES